ncbi:glutaredoxin family protein [Halopseudomonas salina]|nr:glutaredoxin family protein [Halopseudomonas salina]
MNAVPDLTLYGTTACHLCEAATLELAPLQGNGLRPREQDITESDAMMERYQLRIPVLRREDTGAELDWPFDLASAMVFLADVLGEEN